MEELFIQMHLFLMVEVDEGVINNHDIVSDEFKANMDISLFKEQKDYNNKWR